MRYNNLHLRAAVATLPVLLLSLCGIWGCGDAPPAPIEQRGSIEVTGYLPDETLAAFIELTLDDKHLGIFDNPHTITDILAGLHKFEVVTRDTITPDSIEEYSRTEYLIVEAEKVTVTEVTLIQDGPYVGNAAPAYELYDPDANLYSLDDLTGKVALLYFFEST